MHSTKNDLNYCLFSLVLVNLLVHSKYCGEHVCLSICPLA